MRIRSRFMLILLVALSFLAAYFFPGVSENDVIQTSITFIGILFGIIVGFFITDLYTRFNAIRSNAAIDSSCLSTLYSFYKILCKDKNKEWLKKQKILIENYIKKFMPLPWENYAETEPEFSALVSSLEDLKYTTDKENETYSNILGVVSQHSDAREKLVMFGKDKLSLGEWSVILFLGGLLLTSLFYIKDSSWMSVVFTGAISSAILILLFVVNDLNNLNFGEASISVGPYQRVLDAIGKPRIKVSK